MINLTLFFIYCIVFIVLLLVLLYPINDYMQSCMFNTNATGVLPCDDDWSV